jgi:hypothetical protein
MYGRVRAMSVTVELVYSVRMLVLRHIRSIVRISRKVFFVIESVRI